MLENKKIIKNELEDFLNDNCIKNNKVIKQLINSSKTVSKDRLNIINNYTVNMIFNELEKILPSKEWQFIPYELIKKNIEIILSEYIVGNVDLYEVIKIVKLKIMGLINLNTNYLQRYFFNSEKIIMVIRIYHKFLKLFSKLKSINSLSLKYFDKEDLIYSDIKKSNLNLTKVSILLLLDNITYRYFKLDKDNSIKKWINDLKEYDLFKFYEKNYNFNLNKTLFSKYKIINKNFNLYSTFEIYWKKIKDDSIDSINNICNFKISLNGYEVKDNLEILTIKNKQIMVDKNILNDLNKDMYISISNDIYYNNQFRIILIKHLLKTLYIKTFPNISKVKDLDIHHDLFCTKRIHNMKYEEINIKLLKKIVKSYDLGYIYLEFYFKIKTETKMNDYLKNILNSYYNFNNQDDGLLKNIRSNVVDLLLEKIVNNFNKELFFLNATYYKDQKMYKYLKKFKKLMNLKPLKDYNNYKDSRIKTIENQISIYYLIIISSDTEINIYLNHGLKFIDSFNITLIDDSNKYSFKKKIIEIINIYNIDIIFFNGSSNKSKIYFEFLLRLIEEINININNINLINNTEDKSNINEENTKTKKSTSKKRHTILTIFCYNKLFNDLIDKFEFLNINETNENFYERNKIILFSWFINNPLYLTFLTFINKGKIKFGKHYFNKFYFNELSIYILLNNYYFKSDFNYLFPFLKIGINEKYYLKSKSEEDIYKNHESPKNCNFIKIEESFFTDFQKYILPSYNQNYIIFFYKTLNNFFYRNGFIDKKYINEFYSITKYSKYNIIQNLYYFKSYIKRNYGIKILNNKQLYSINSKNMLKYILKKNIKKFSLQTMVINQINNTYIQGTIQDVFSAKLFYNNIYFKNKIIKNKNDAKLYFLIEEEIRVKIKEFDKANIIKLEVVYNENSLNKYNNFLEENNILGKYNLNLKKNFNFNLREDFELIPSTLNFKNFELRKIDYIYFLNCNRNESHNILKDKKIGYFLIRPLKGLTWIIDFKISNNYIQEIKIKQDYLNLEEDNLESLYIDELKFKNEKELENNYIKPLNIIIEDIIINSIFIDTHLMFYDNNYKLKNSVADLIWYKNNDSLKLLLIYKNNQDVIIMEIIKLLPESIFFHSQNFKTIKELLIYFNINKNLEAYNLYIENNKECILKEDNININNFFEISEEEEVIETVENKKSNIVVNIDLSNDENDNIYDINENNTISNDILSNNSNKVENNFNRNRNNRNFDKNENKDRRFNKNNNRNNDDNKNRRFNNNNRNFRNNDDNIETNDNNNYGWKNKRWGANNNFPINNRKNNSKEELEINENISNNRFNNNLKENNEINSRWKNINKITSDWNTKNNNENEVIKTEQSKVNNSRWGNKKKEENNQNINEENSNNKGKWGTKNKENWKTKNNNNENNENNNRWKNKNNNNGNEDNENNNKRWGNNNEVNNNNNKWGNRNNNNETNENNNDINKRWGNKNNNNEANENNNINKGWGVKNNENRCWSNKSNINNNEADNIKVEDNNNYKRGWGNKNIKIEANENNDNKRGWGNKNTNVKVGDNNDNKRSWGNKNNNEIEKSDINIKGWGNKNKNIKVEDNSDNKKDCGNISNNEIENHDTSIKGWGNKNIRTWKNKNKIENTDNNNNNNRNFGNNSNDKEENTDNLKWENKNNNRGWKNINNNDNQNNNRSWKNNNNQNNNRRWKNNDNRGYHNNDNNNNREWKNNDNNDNQNNNRRWKNNDNNVNQNNHNNQNSWKNNNNNNDKNYNNKRYQNNNNNNQNNNREWKNNYNDNQNNDNNDNQNNNRRWKNNDNQNNNRDLKNNNRGWKNNDNNGNQNNNKGWKNNDKDNRRNNYDTNIDNNNKRYGNTNLNNEKWGNNKVEENKNNNQDNNKWENKKNTDNIENNRWESENNTRKWGNKKNVNVWGRFKNNENINKENNSPKRNIDDDVKNNIKKNYDEQKNLKWNNFKQENDKDNANKTWGFSNKSSWNKLKEKVKVEENINLEKRENFNNN